MSLLHKSQHLPKLCCLQGEEAGFWLPTQKCLRIFETVFVSSAAPLMGGGLPSILYHIYQLGGVEKEGLSLAMLPVPTAEVFAQETTSEPSLFTGQLPEVKSQNNVNKNVELHPMGAGSTATGQGRGTTHISLFPVSQPCSQIQAQPPEKTQLPALLQEGRSRDVIPAKGVYCSCYVTP